MPFAFNIDPVYEKFALAVNLTILKLPYKYLIISKDNFALPLKSILLKVSFVRFPIF